MGYVQWRGFTYVSACAYRQDRRTESASDATVLVDGEIPLHLPGLSREDR
jgi:hypothetical protein